MSDFRYRDGWPIMEPLDTKEAKYRDRNMANGEKILGQVIGNYRQAVIATTHKVLIVKTGYEAGQTFGGMATSFDYHNIMGVEVRARFTRCEFELIIGGLVVPRGNRKDDKIEAEKSVNAIAFKKSNQRLFDSMAAQIRMISGQPRGINLGQPPGRNRKPWESSTTHSGSSVPEQIRQLAELYDAGILTKSEFEAKKAELLKRM